MRMIVLVKESKFPMTVSVSALWSIGKCQEMRLTVACSRLEKDAALTMSRGFMSKNIQSETVITLCTGRCRKAATVHDFQLAGLQ